MSVLYIAGPMSGLPEHNYPAFFDAEEQLLTAGHNVLNPARIDELCSLEPGPRVWEWYKRRALRMLTDADGVALLPDWQRSRGASIEWVLARDLSIPRADLAHWTKQVAA